MLCSPNPVPPWRAESTWLKGYIFHLTKPYVHGAVFNQRK